jgi:mannose-6-phosphate isomerase-like protein (cupin superfamily)
MTGNSHRLPGAIGVSHLTVYPQSGSPHMHLACSESYVVIEGSGSVQTLTLSGYRETPLKAGAVVWFPPGTIHRLINDGDLRIAVIMQNSGLPEAGDAVLTFPPSYLEDGVTYAATRDRPALPERRDLAVEGFERLRDAALAGDFGPLREFHAAAVRIVQPQLKRWRETWEAGALAAAQATGRHLDSLEAGAAPHLSNADVYQLAEPTERGRHGMCGYLDTYVLA